MKKDDDCMNRSRQTTEESINTMPVKSVTKQLQRGKIQCVRCQRRIFSSLLSRNFCNGMVGCIICFISCLQILA